MKLLTTACIMLSIMGGVVLPQPNLTNLKTEVQPYYGTVKVNATTFPDEEFRRLVLNHYSTGDELNEMVKNPEIYFDCNEYDIQDFSGIEYFTDVEFLKINGYKHETLDLTGLHSSATTFGLDANNQPYYISLDLEVTVINSPNVSKVVTGENTGNKITLLMNGVKTDTLDVSGVPMMKDFINVNSSITSLYIKHDQPLVRFLMMGVPNLTTIHGRVNAEEIILADMPLATLNFRPERLYTLDLINTNISDVNLLAHAVHLEWLLIGGNQFKYLNLPDLVSGRVDYHDYSGAVYAYPLMDYLFVDSEFEGVEPINVKANKVAYVAQKTSEGYVVSTEGINMDNVLLPEDSKWTIEGSNFVSKAQELPPLNYYYKLVEPFAETDSLCFDNSHAPSEFDAAYPGEEQLRNTHMYVMSELTVKEDITKPDPQPEPEPKPEPETKPEPDPIVDPNPVPKEEPAVAPENNNGPATGDTTSVFGMFILLAGATTVLAKKKKHQ
ncbi:hypothetical protein A4S06_08265 [Erysipelotrichaceae bacterium MTC7]|nr:hypothetical protein A4S06_08265 [Erysipelotrichaceae bacterium MTC7]